ncbi:MAG TPA: 23S rRNA (guanosine(2251)-2'-O)-methyltransferase RlmB [Proteobacteria bacterium]|nr:23S rRNA (guanosine(2251)-2'-O)-methyltransferase RlmB [Pseudomonadota bacterium]
MASAISKADGGQDLVCGINAVTELLARSSRILTLYLLDTGGRRLKDLGERARDQGISVKIVPGKALDRLASGIRHQGVAAQVAPFVFTPLVELLRTCAQAPSGALLLALDGVTDPRNLGAIIRTAVAAGVAGLLLPERRSAAITPAAAKTAAGALEKLPICRVVNLADALQQCRAAGFWIYGAAASGGDDLYAVDWAASLVLVLGSEDKGLRPIINRACDFQVSIPLSRESESLNVGVAAAVALFEIKRCRRIKNEPFSS